MLSMYGVSASSLPSWSCTKLMSLRSRSLALSISLASSSCTSWGVVSRRTNGSSSAARPSTSSCTVPRFLTGKVRSFMSDNAKFSVARVSVALRLDGETVAIMHVLQLPVKASFSSKLNREVRNGGLISLGESSSGRDAQSSPTTMPSMLRPLLTAHKPGILVSLMRRSEPARSMKSSLALNAFLSSFSPGLGLGPSKRSSRTLKIAWERAEAPTSCVNEATRCLVP
mmetsp:Transcript_97143/g.274615  ORF Transcript_97143/g.274615 Transcript_97143/m.274615 type:complete len:227 (-) Transcript_97143:671-1351(-)